MSMSKEKIRDLSYNPESDYNMILFESLIDEAVCNVKEIERQIYGDVDPSLESLTDMFQDDIDYYDEEYVSESLLIAYEGALADLGTKIKRAWEELKRKCKAFFSRVSESLKNIASRFQAMWTSGRVKADIKLSAARKNALDAIPDLTKLLDNVDMNSIHGIIEKMQTISNNYENEKESKNEESISVGDVKKHIDNLAKCLKASSKALSKMDSMITKSVTLKNTTGDMNIDNASYYSKMREGENNIYEIDITSDPKQVFDDARKLLTETMKFVRESITAIANAVKIANSSQKNANKDKKKKKKQ